MQRKRWSSTSDAARTRFLRHVCAMPSNKRLSGEKLAEKYFTGVTRGGLIVYCWRHRIALPRTRKWPERRRKIRANCR